MRDAGTDVVLLPGLGLGGIELRLLARRLRRRGYAIRLFRYFPWRGTLDDYAARLTVFAAPDGRWPHLVGHSLGGLVATRALALAPPTRTCRLVTLGSPHVGCTAAARIGRIPGGRRLLGRALASAVAASPVRVPERVELGSIAGTFSAGIGWCLRLPRPNDSVVRVAETRHPDATACVALPVSHAAMLVATRVVAEIDRFLATGRFSH